MAINDEVPRPITSLAAAMAPSASRGHSLAPRSMCLAAATWLLIAAVQPAQGQATPQSATTCTTSEHRRFDFWLGTWDVQGRHGEQLGTNVITSEFGGCVIKEQWRSLRSAHRGSSYNIFDRRSERWHQTWVDNSGLLLELNGGWRDSAMVLEGRTREANGGQAIQRITWTPRPDGTLRQLWEQSRDGGRSWSVAFDGLYVRRR